MPTVHRFKGLTFKVLTRDHDPPHVHVYTVDGTAKIGLGSEVQGPYLMANVGMRAGDVRLAVQMVEQHQGRFLEAWRKYRG